MSASPHQDRSMGYAGLRMSADDFFSLGETTERYELIDGVVVMSPSPTPRHNELLAEILFQLKLFSRTGEPIRVFPETDVSIRLAKALPIRADEAQKVYRPDVSVYLQHRLPVPCDRLAIAPDLVIEILSPGSKALDLVTKRDDYEAFGVREYWALDPADARIRCWQRHDEANVLLEAPVLGDALPSAAIIGFTLDLLPVRRLAGTP